MQNYSITGVIGGVVKANQWCGWRTTLKYNKLFSNITFSYQCKVSRRKSTQIWTAVYDKNGREKWVFFKSKQCFISIYTWWSVTSINVLSVHGTQYIHKAQNKCQNYKRQFIYAVFMWNSQHPYNETKL